MRIVVVVQAYLDYFQALCFSDFGHQCHLQWHKISKDFSLTRGEIPIFEPDLDALSK